MAILTGIIASSIHEMKFLTNLKYVFRIANEEKIIFTFFLQLINSTVQNAENSDFLFNFWTQNSKFQRFRAVKKCYPKPSRCTEKRHYKVMIIFYWWEKNDNKASNSSDMFNIRFKWMLFKSSFSSGGNNQSEWIFQEFQTACSIEYESNFLELNPIAIVFEFWIRITNQFVKSGFESDSNQLCEFWDLNSQILFILSYDVHAI